MSRVSGTERDPDTEQALRQLGAEPDRALSVDGVPLRQLAERYGTPLYVFSAQRLRAQVERVQRVLGPRVEVLWSVKANPSVAVTRCLREAGTGAEVASLGELEVALAATRAQLQNARGVQAKKISYLLLLAVLWGPSFLFIRVAVLQCHAIFPTPLLGL